MFDPDDSHLCIKCNRTVIGLEEYIQHRKLNCLDSNKTDCTFEEQSYEDDKNKKTFPIHNFECDLGADIFFSSLELQSSNKKQPIKEKKNDSEKQLQDTNYHKNGDNSFNYFISDEESNHSEMVFDDNIPPRTHTGGKWKPENRPSTSAFVSSNWHQIWKDDDDEAPPPEYTKGKWVPGSKNTKIQHVNIPHWCTVCNRNLASKIVYKRHLKSNAHIRRLQEENELEAAKPLISSANFPRRNSKITKNLIQENLQTQDTKGRKRRKFFTKCDTCKIRLPVHLLGKHLISHYHFIRMQKNLKKSHSQIIENFERIIVLSPFQCKPCRYYANTEINFLNHWNSKGHLQNIQSIQGEFLCKFCKYKCSSQEQMTDHLMGFQHQEVIQLINRSAPIIIQKIYPINCKGCNKVFRYNIELKKHDCTSMVKSNENHFLCGLCGKKFKSRLSLQKHQKILHDLKVFFCNLCNLEFETAKDAQSHRRTSKHKTLSARSNNKQTKVKHCMICNINLKDILDLKEHMKLVHPDKKHTCLYCGLSFTLSQELSRHVRDKNCNNFPKSILLQPLHQNNDDDNNSLVTSDTEIAEYQIRNENGTILTMKQPKNKEKIQATSGAGTTSSYIHASASSNNTFNDNVDETFGNSDTDKCKLCSFRSDSKADLVFHNLLHTLNAKKSNNEKIDCPFCKKKFSKTSLQRHLKIHTDERKFKCQICTSSFVTQSNLKDHMRNIHSTNETLISKQYACKLCDKKFKQKHNLLQHMFTHKNVTDQKGFKCTHNECTFTGRSVAEVRQHQSKHSETKEFHCDIQECTYVGKTIVHLRRHMESHQSPKKIFFCSICEFSTRYSSHLSRHQRIHNTIKRFDCPHCEYQCNTLDNLRKHVIKAAKHRGRFLFECAECGLGTNKTCDFKNHMFTKHSSNFDLKSYFDSK